MKTVSVITGDIINSKGISNKEHLINSLLDIIKTIESKYTFVYPFEIFRGDSLQAVLKNPKHTARIFFIFKSGLLSKSTEYQMYKIRISAGISSIDFINKDVKISNGRAFELSGEELDKMKFNGKTISILTENQNRNEMLNLLNNFSEVLTEKWSKQSAEVIYLSLLNDYKQKEIAQILNISQSAVQQRLSAANYEMLNNYIRFFENLNWR